MLGPGDERADGAPHDGGDDVTTIIQWLEDNREGAAKLAQAVSLATTVEPELLRAARLELCPGLGVEAESSVWFSPLVDSRSAIGISFSGEALQRVWAELKGNEPLFDRINDIRDLTAKYHQGIAPALQWEEEIVYWALSGKPEAADTIRARLQSILKTLLAPENARLAVWAERALPRMPDAVRVDTTFALVAQAAFERGAGCRRCPVPPTVHPG